MATSRMFWSKINKKYSGPQKSILQGQNTLDNHQFHQNFGLAERETPWQEFDECDTQWEWVDSQADGVTNDADAAAMSPGCSRVRRFI